MAETTRPWFPNARCSMSTLLGRGARAVKEGQEAGLSPQALAAREEHSYQGAMLAPMAATTEEGGTDPTSCGPSS